MLYEVKKKASITAVIILTLKTYQLMFDFQWWLYAGLYQAPWDKAILFDYNILNLIHLCSCKQGSTQFNLLIGESLDFKFYFLQEFKASFEQFVYSI